MKELYFIRRTQESVTKITDRPVRANSRGAHQSRGTVNKMSRALRELLSRPLPNEIAHTEPADTPLKPLQVNENRPVKAKIKRAIRYLKNGRPAGRDGIPPRPI